MSDAPHAGRSDDLASFYAGMTSERIPQGRNAQLHNWYEAPGEDPEHLEMWCYTDRISYEHGDVICFHTNTTGQHYDVEIYRDGVTKESVYRKEKLPGRRHPTPDDCSVRGCGWPPAFELEVARQWRSGVYVVLTYAHNDKGEVRRHEHFFVVRAASPGEHTSIAFVLPTCTYVAYNHWGGSGSYLGITGPEGLDMSPELSLRRPWERGFVIKPEGAARLVHEHDAERVLPGWAPRLPESEWAYYWGYGRWCASAGWAAYDRYFAVWAEQNGYRVDYLTQHDLHSCGELLKHYKCVVIVGHDEYWSWEMRDALDEFTAAGGNLARFAGNFIWQVRLENNGHTQVCYKQRAREEDPVMHDSKNRHLLTEAWEGNIVRRPGAQTVGVNGVWSAIYARTAAHSPRAHGGWTVYRPKHWAFEGTDLYFGDTFGMRDLLAGFEMDGLHFTFKDGLPFPVGDDGSLPETEILAMHPTDMPEDVRDHEGAVYLEGDETFRILANMLFTEKEDYEKIRHSAGMIVSTRKGDGEIFCAGGSEWVYGLRHRNIFAEIITRNVLDRFSA